MHTSFFAFVLFSSSVLGAEFSQIVNHNFGAMLRRGNALAKRQGYYPSSRPCGSGTTCAEACGTGQVECPADASRGVCFNPSSSQCCPDGSGYSCDNGYFCSSDGQTNTYCCPNGMDLGACAQAYSLTVSLISQTGTMAIPAETGIASESASAALPTSTAPIITNIPSSPSLPVEESNVPTTTVPVITGVGNGTYATGSPSLEFPGVATKSELAGIVIFAGFAVFVGVFMT